jgi:hypothetical protein
LESLPAAIAVVSLLVASLPLACLGLQTMACKQWNHWYHPHHKTSVVASLLVVSSLLLQGNMIVCVIVAGLSRLWLSQVCQSLSLLACQGCVAAVVMIALLPLLSSLAASSHDLLTLFKKLSKMLRTREGAMAVS